MEMSLEMSQHEENVPYLRARRAAWIAATFLGMTAVILGALGAHALKQVLSPEALASYETGVRYQMYHALALLVLSLTDGRWGLRPGLLRSAMLCLGVGTLFFSGSIYLLVLFNLKVVALVTPTGGLILVAGWLLLLLSALRPAQT